MLVTVIILAAMFGLVMWQYNAQIKVLEKHHEKQQTQVVSQESEQEHQCAELAFSRYRTLGLEANRTAKYKGHYNTARNQCYALIESTDASLDTLWKRITLYDGDGKVFGTYAWRSEHDRKPSDVPPFNCDVAMPTGDHRVCSSETEFRYFADTYMK
jgi:hypothetical protein